MGVQGLRRTVIALLACALGCTEAERQVFGNRAEGDACDQTSDCKPGLLCDGTCKKIPPSDTAGLAGKECDASKPCNTGLCCGNQGVCREILPGFPSGKCGYPTGSACGVTADCDNGLICNGLGECGAPTGTNAGAVGASCTTISDCQRPLFCGLQKTCEKLPFFPGVSCARAEDELGAFRVYWEVPRGMPLDEFYRQPFPSDVRVVDGKLSMAGHPSPGAVMGLDFAQLYIHSLEEDFDGFGLTQPVFFQLSDEAVESTLGVNTSTATIILVGLTKGSPHYNVRIPLQTVLYANKGQFLCANSLAAAPVDGFALLPKTTYGMLILSGITSVRGEKPIHDGDFEVMISSATPQDEHLAKAHMSMAPLRDYLNDPASKLTAADVAAASVFTTGDPAKIAAKIREAVRAAPAPAIKNLTLCGAGVQSPCDFPGKNRGCEAASPNHYVFHGKVTNPVLQKGTRPYQFSGPDGREGAFILDANGRPAVQGSEDLCFSLSIPRSAKPAAGWPVLIYSHGTGGDFTSAMDIAGDMAMLTDPPANVAVLGYDNVMHGPRQGLPPAMWAEDPGRLFFNAANPRGARDNVLQGAGDLFNLRRMLEAAITPPAGSGITGAINFDQAHVMFYGHSQGTVVAPPFLIAEPGLRAAVLTGAGGEIGLTVINKRKPTDIASLVRAAFGDQSVSRMHPMIAILTQFFGGSDFIPFARHVAQQPIAPRTKGLDMLHVYGLGDGFTPEVTQQALVRAFGVPIVGQALRPIPGVQVVAGELRNNLNMATAGVLQYPRPCPADTTECDGHFVGTRIPEAKAAIYRFLANAATQAGPSVIRR